MFTFRVEPPDTSKANTKRNVLSTIAAVYDPLRFFPPFLVRANILMNEIWRADMDRDDSHLFKAFSPKSTESSSCRPSYFLD